MSHPGMFQPTQKDGTNWHVDFTLTRLSTGETVTGTKNFRVRANAYDWIAAVKNQTVEANELKQPSCEGFTYKVRKA